MRAGVVALACMIVSPVAADLLWDNHLEHDVETGGRAFGGSAWSTVYVADNFSIFEPARLEVLRFEALIGANFVLDEAEIWIYEDPSGGRGNQPPQNPRSVGRFAGTGFDTGRRDRGRRVFRYSVPFEYTIEPGHYFLALHLHGPGVEAYWATSSGGQGGNTPGWFSRDNRQSWTYEGPPPAPWDHAFELHGTVVPEPATIVVLSTGIVALIARGRRNRPK